MSFVPVEMPWYSDMDSAERAEQMQDQQAALVHKARHKLREARREIARLTQQCQDQTQAAE